MTDNPWSTRVTGKGAPSCRSRGKVAALPIPLCLLGGILFGVAGRGDVGLGITLGLGAGAVVTGIGARGWGRPGEARSDSPAPP